MKSAVLALIFLAPAVAIAQGPQQPVVSGAVTLGSPCIPGSPFYANLANGQMVSCQQVNGTGPFTWTLVNATSGPVVIPPATNGSIGGVQLPPNGTSPILGLQPSGVQGWVSQNALSLGCKGDGSTDDTACIQSIINNNCTPSSSINCTIDFPNTGSCYKITQPLVIGDGATQTMSITLRGQQQAFGGSAAVQGTCIRQDTYGQTALIVKEWPNHSNSLTIAGLYIKYNNVFSLNGFYSVSGNTLTGLSGLAGQTPPNTFPASIYVPGGEAMVYVEGSASWSTPCLSNLCTVTATPVGNTLTLSGSCSAGCATAANPKQYAVGALLHFPYVSGTTLMNGVTLLNNTIQFGGVGIAADYGLQSCNFTGNTIIQNYIGWLAGGSTNNCTLINNTFQSGTNAIHIPPNAIFNTTHLAGNVIEAQLGPQWLVYGKIVGGSDVSSWHELSLDDIYRFVGNGSMKDVAVIDPRFDATSVQGGINTSSLNAGGTSYTAGDFFTVSGGLAGSLASGVINSVDGGGAVLTYTVTQRGLGYSIANAVATTGGTGSGFLINILGLGQNFFSIMQAPSSQGLVQNIKIQNGFMLGTGNGYFTYLPLDPSSSSDPGFLNWSIEDVEVGSSSPPLLKGFHTATTAPNAMNYLKDGILSLSQVVTNSVNSLVPFFYSPRAGGIGFAPGPTGRPMTWAKYVVQYCTSPLTGVCAGVAAGNFTITPQNGGTATTVAAPAAATLNLILFLAPGAGVGSAVVQGGDIKGVYIRTITACTGTTTLAINGFGTNGTPTLFASTTTPTGYVLNYDLMAAPSVTNLYDPPFLNSGLNTDAAQNIVVRLASTGGNINAITNNCAFNVDVLWSPIP